MLCLYEFEKRGFFSLLAIWNAFSFGRDSIHEEKIVQLRRRIFVPPFRGGNSALEGCFFFGFCWRNVPFEEKASSKKEVLLALTDTVLVKSRSGRRLFDDFGKDWIRNSWMLPS